MKILQGNFQEIKDSQRHQPEETEKFRPLTPPEELQVCALLCKYGGRHCVENLENNTNALCVKHSRIFLEMNVFVTRLLSVVPEFRADEYFPSSQSAVV